ncbi:UDP-N-acetylglucosamine 2-epimerase (hydrolyzing) [Candidatus Parcubacteria bacterium]|nr:UDP-N-acetylglucosamine 2-epimerase (hydrolyzing) [Candidatus Parcubacteria bacterium]
MKKILYISGTRADYGLMRRALLTINKHPKLEVEVIAAGMHLMPEFGETIKEIRKDNLKIYRIDAVYENDNRESSSCFIGEFVQLFAKRIKRIRPDIILLLGDRAEMLGGAIVGTYSAIPVIHIHGGDLSFTVDEFVRHAITKLSHFHLPATKKSAERIIKMGENSWRVSVVGAPGLDDILGEKLFSKKEIAKKYKLDFNNPVLLVIQHPVVEEDKTIFKQISETMEAVKETGLQSIVIYPNADAGGRSMIKVIEEYRKCSFIQIYKSFARKDYLSLMNIASVMIGNSSSGIIESSVFHLPVINIGTRQKGRERSENVINVDYNKEQIKKAIQKALYNKKFREKVKKCKNPYGNGNAGIKIAGLLSKIKINNKLLQKQITY